MKHSLYDLKEAYVSLEFGHLKNVVEFGRIALGLKEQYGSIRKLAKASEIPFSTLASYVGACEFVVEIGFQPSLTYRNLNQAKGFLKTLGLDQRVAAVHLLESGKSLPDVKASFGVKKTPSTPPTPPVSDIDRLKAENARLRAENQQLVIDKRRLEDTLKAVQALRKKGLGKALKKVA
jgi:hypothetical protein